MAEQQYLPYRTVLLSKEQLASFNELRFPRVAADIAVLWVQIALAWGVAAFADTWWVAVLAAIVVGNRYYSLFIIGHDGLHRRLHARRETNDLVNDVLVLGPIGAITRINRLNHMKHHRTLACAGDPDAYKYQDRWRAGPLGYLLSLTGITFVLRAVGNVFVGEKVAKPGVERERYSLRDIAIVLGWQIVLFATLTLLFGWWGYLGMWWIPVYAFTFAADITRVFCEHSSERADATLEDRLVMFSAPRLELALFAPMNMNHHVAHHLWPSIPYYNLPSATRALYANVDKLPPSAAAPPQRSSYVGYLLKCLRLARAGVAQ